MDKLVWLYDNLVAGKQKAIVAFIVTAVVAQASQHGVDTSLTLEQALEALLWGVLGFVGVYFKRNQ